MHFYGADCRRIRGFLLVGLSFILLPKALAGPLFFSFDEWGKGFMCDATAASATIPLCSSNPTTHLGSFARIHSGFVFDPTVGGGSSVLAYTLPFDAGNIDLFMSAAGEPNEDLIRFIGTTMYFYSLKHGSGDGLADVAAMPPARTAFVMTTTENGPEGDNHGLFIHTTTGGLVEFIPHSDELTACPPLLLLFHACGPNNVAPPPSNPTRDITGFGGPIIRVDIPAFNPFDPIATNVPEPETFWLFAGALLIYTCRRMLPSRAR